MRAAPVLLLLALSGCLSHGCWADGGTVSWLQPGVHGELLAVEGVAAHSQEATRGVPVDAPAAAAFLGAPPRLSQLKHADVDLVRLQWNDGVVVLDGYVGERGPGPREHRQAAEDLLVPLVGPDAARAWLTENLSPSRDQSYSVPVDLDLEPGPVLDGAAGPWHISEQGRVEVEDGALLWVLFADVTSFHVPGQPPVEVVGTDRVVVSVHEDPADLEAAVALGSEALEAYGVEARPSAATWKTQYVCN